MEPVSDPPSEERSHPVSGAGEERRAPTAASNFRASPHPWDGYLTGPENELAMAAAQAMARGEDDGISPLIVYGPPGVGKSRLLAGLVTERLHRQPDAAVAYLDAAAFVGACFDAAAVAGRVGWSTLRSQFRSVDLFVLEDLEGLERGPLARDELVHTLDALDASGAAMAFSARTAPAMWLNQTWPRRLVTRLMGGLATRITSPGLASRRRYVLQHAGLQGVILQAEAVETLAQAADGYRTLEGWISRLALELRLRHEQEGRERIHRTRHGGEQARGQSNSYLAPLDPCTVATLLADETFLTGPLVTIDVIAQGVASRFNVRLSMLRGPTRRASVVSARHVAMYLARTVVGLSFAAIGTYFGGRDSATVRHACKTIAERLIADPTLAAAVASLDALWSRNNA